MPIVAPVAQIAEEAKRWAQISRLSPEAFKQARGSIRRAALTEHGRGITAIYNVGQGRAKQDITIRDTEAGMIVRASNKPITLLSYGWKPTRKGIAGRVLKKGGRATIPRSFVAKGLGGGTVPFIRDGEPRIMTAGRYAGKRRQPVRALYGPSVADAIVNPAVVTDLRERIWGRSRVELSRRLQQLTRRR